jgi:hypothetical protein
MNLLQDLVMYVYTGHNCKLILLGDTAQLPPVGSEESPAMSAKAFKDMGLKVMRATITRTVRQKQRSGILYNATWLRRAMQEVVLPEPQLTVSPFFDVDVVDPEELEDELGKSFAEYGEEQTIMITRSNRRAVDFNLAIRQQIFDREEILARGDRLLISKNNYYWTTLARHKAREAAAAQPASATSKSANFASPAANIAQSQGPANVAPLTTVAEAEAEASTPQAPQARIPDFLANGEVAIVDEIYATETVDDIRFADVRLWLPEANTDIEAKIVLDSLTAETAGLPRPKIETLAHRALFNAGAEQGSATAQREALKTCPYFNALQVKYAYAVTCHKAQGGQWTSVFVDMGYIPHEAYRTPDFYRWLYTSITRATTSLHLLNPSCLIR